MTTRIQYTYTVLHCAPQVVRFRMVSRTAGNCLFTVELQVAMSKQVCSFSTVSLPVIIIPLLSSFSFPSSLCCLGFPKAPSEPRTPYWAVPSRLDFNLSDFWCAGKSLGCRPAALTGGTQAFKLRLPWVPGLPAAFKCIVCTGRPYPVDWVHTDRCTLLYVF